MRSILTLGPHAIALHRFHQKYRGLVSRLHSLVEGSVDFLPILPAAFDRFDFFVCSSGLSRGISKAKVEDNVGFSFKPQNNFIGLSGFVDCFLMNTLDFAQRAGYEYPNTNYTVSPPAETINK